MSRVSSLGTLPSPAIFQRETSENHMTDQPQPSTEVSTEVAPAPELRESLKMRDLKIGSSGINFTNAGEVMAFAKMMSQSGFAVRPFFRDNPGACLAVIDDDIGWGMSRSE